MTRLILRWLFTSLAILMLPSLINGIAVDDFGAAVAAAAILGVLNLLVRPILVFLTFPFTLISLGLFLLVINAFVLQLVGHLVEGFHIAGFGAAFLGALVVSVVSWISHWAVDSSSGRARVVVYRSQPGSRYRDVTP